MTSPFGALKPPAAKELIAFLHRTDTKRSTLLLGPPGIGKSVLVRETAEEIASVSGRTLVEYRRHHLQGFDLEDVFRNPDRYFLFIDLRLTETEPVDLLGRPATVTVAGRRQLVYHPPQWALLLSEVPGILFLDEITNVHRPDVMAAAYKLIQERAAGFVGFRADVQVIAAGNRPEHSIVANPLPAPLLNRVYQVTVDPPALEQWMDWMNRHHPGCDERVLAYLHRFPQDFCCVNGEGETLEGYPTPRSYTSLARDLAAAESAGLERSVLCALCTAALGREVGEKLFAFLEHTTPDYADLLRDPTLFTALEIDQRYIAATVIGQGMAQAVRAALRAAPPTADVTTARSVIRPCVADALDLLDTVAAQSREYLTLMWFVLSNRLEHPAREALFLEMCSQSEAVLQTYSAVGELLR